MYFVRKTSNSLVQGLSIGRIEILLTPILTAFYHPKTYKPAQYCPSRHKFLVLNTEQIPFVKDHDFGGFSGLASQSVGEETAFGKSRISGG